MFCFNIKSYKSEREGFIEIRMEYWLNEDKERSIMVEFVPREKFCDDKKYSEYILDSMFFKAKQNIWNKLTNTP